MRNHYWTTSKFADWLRGTVKADALGSREWREWHRAARSRHPVRYWLAEEGLDYAQRFFYYIPDRIYAVKYYVNNRWVTRTQALTAHADDITPGTWCDVGYRFLPCLFNELRNFVEVELAWWHIAWASAEEKAKYRAPFWATGWFRWRTWRCAEAGLDNLSWQMSLTNKEWCSEDHPDYGKPTRQAEAAREIYELYNWWVNVRPMRPEPMAVSGWSAYCDQRHRAGESWFDVDESNPVDTRPMLDMMNELEAKYEKEDEDMMIRLIKIRQALWT